MKTHPLEPSGGHEVAALAESIAATPAAAPRSPLFREQAVRAMSAHAPGEVLLAPALSHASLAAFFAVAAVAVAAALVLVQYSPKARVAGVLMPEGGWMAMAATQPAAVARVLVADGERVRAGQALVEFAGDRAGAHDGASAERTAAALLERQHEAQQRAGEITRAALAARAAAADRRRASLIREADAADRQVGFVRQALEAARVREAREAALAKQGFVSDAAVAASRAAVAEQQARLADAERLAVAARRVVDEAQAEREEFAAQERAQREEARRQAAITQVDIVATRARAATLALAPRDAVVGSVFVREGQTVQAGQPLVRLARPDAALQAQLLVPPRTAGFLRVGQRVLIDYDAYAAHAFGHATGVVQSVSSSTSTPEELASLGLAGAGVATPAAAGTGVYRVSVALDRQSVLVRGGDEPLRAGATLRASVELGARPLYRWLLGPLLDGARRL